MEEQSGEGEDDGEGDDLPSFPSIHPLFSAWCVAGRGFRLFIELLNDGFGGAADDSTDLWLDCFWGGRVLHGHWSEDPCGDPCCF
ncbi:hypothetical protein SUGI_1188730 [Cryptomeria japonica]|nr:hypothetical protein SUGI_1188530 [Cryptomeria japonica]GLJ55376.1 hypothetical protein SUGI_1188730 [Cryptomeria japonica]